MRTIMDGVSTIDDLDVDGRRVLLRTDFNVPLTSASAGAAVTVADDTRIRAALPTIEELLRRGARLVLVSHPDRQACPDPGFSMRPVAERLAQLTGASVPLAPGATGPAVRELTERLAPGAMLMLESVSPAGGRRATIHDLPRRWPSSRTCMWTTRSGASTGRTPARKALPTCSRARPGV